ncbi:glycosyltransferase [Paenibacillus methanolicus]|uniref:Glycosyltransferase involved in cell wall biosynthesis n=1 Tax=Paenibacillus methanolicus TaxID=582686 RepID=A0A5S5BSG7_9BACL|nr:glycosyltransferase [Paenibacillus methanolicus]TYP69132.1 glycosyltransferase involved in cell wall biosynthesis [Paenibacillus methanolicus]
MEPVISVIVPTYNAEEFLPRCLDSILAQTFANIEVIVVNDGSKDRSGIIADEYSVRDSRVRVIHKENSGAGKTRNSGLEIARGQYIGFVDADDWIAPEMYEELYQAAVRDQSEVAMADFYRVTDRGQPKPKCTNLKQTLYENKSIIDNILILMFGADSKADDDVAVEMCVWRNIYKRELIERNGIQFYSEREYISEDLVFNIEVLTRATRVSIVNKPLYYYVLNINSLTKKYQRDRFEKDSRLYLYMRERLNEIGMLRDNEERLMRTFIGRARTCIISEARDNKQDNVRMRIKRIRSITNDSMLQEVIRSYPIFNYSLKLQIFTYCMRLRLAEVLFMLAAYHPQR